MLDHPHYVYSHAYETNMRLNYGHVLYQPFVNCKTHQQPSGTKEPVIYFTFLMTAESKEALEAACVEFERKFYAATYRHAVYLDPRGWNVAQLHNPKPGPDFESVPVSTWRGILMLGIPESHASDIHQLAEDIIHQKVTVRQEERAHPIRKWMRFNRSQIVNAAAQICALIAITAVIAFIVMRQQDFDKVSAECAHKGGVYVKYMCVKTDSIIQLEAK